MASSYDRSGNRIGTGVFNIRYQDRRIRVDIASGFSVPLDLPYLLGGLRPASSARRYQGYNRLAFWVTTLPWDRFSCVTCRYAVYIDVLVNYPHVLVDTDPDDENSSLSIKKVVPSRPAEARFVGAALDAIEENKPFIIQATHCLDAFKIGRKARP